MKIKTKPIAWKDLTDGIEIDIPITDETRPCFQKSGLNNLFREKVTIYNDIAKTAVEERHFDRFVIENCNIQRGLVSRADGTVENVVNAITVISKDVKRYKNPMEYATLPIDLRESKYTIQIGDFVVLGEVEDIATTSREFAEIQEKYKDNGFVIRSVSTNINGMAVDNVQMANVG